MARGGKETFAVSNHLTRHALLVNTWESMIAINTLFVELIGMSAGVSISVMNAFHFLAHLLTVVGMYLVTSKPEGNRVPSKNKTADAFPIFP